MVKAGGARRPCSLAGELGRVLAVAAAVCSIGLLTHCASLRDITQSIRKPRVRITAVELEALSFSGVTLRFDVQIDNPNPIGIELSGFDYELEIEKNPFLSGEVDQKLSIAARGQSVVPIPVDLDFDQLLNTFAELAGKEEARLRLSAGFSFDLPIVGEVRIPVSSKASVPIIRVPRLEVSSLRLEHISLSGANLVLDLELENPNSFAVFIESLEYRFQVEDRDWASGLRQEAVRLPKRRPVTMEVPINLDFFAVGAAVYESIMSGEALRYKLAANVEVGTELAVLKKASLSFQKAGQLRIKR